MAAPTWNQRLAALREKLGLSQPAMAEKLGVTRVWLSYLENNQREVSELLQIKIAQLEAANSVDVSSIHGEGATDELREFSWRLKSTLAKQGAEDAFIAGRMGIPVAKLQAWKAGQQKPKAREGRDLSALLDVRFDWLMSGEGSPTDVVNDDAGVPDAMHLREVGVISWTHAGQAARYEEMPTHFQEKVATMSRDRRARALRVEGDCMLPEIKEGDAVVFEPSCEPTNGSIVVAKLKDDGVMVRIFTKQPGNMVRLTTYRPDSYPAIDRHRRDFDWIYPVADLVRRFRR